MTLTLSKEALQEVYKKDNKLPKLIDIDVHDTKLKQKVKQQTIEDFYVALQIVVKDDDRRPVVPNDLFSKLDDKHEEAKKLLVVGGPGVGKTTLLHYLTWQWGLGDTWDGKFDYVFRIKLKNLTISYPAKTDKHPLAALVHYSLPDDAKKAFTIEQIAEIVENPDIRDKVLFLIDGYDEVKKIVKDKESGLPYILYHNILENPNVVMTSRSNGLTRDDKDTFERVVESTGLDASEVDKYIDKYFAGEDETGAALKALLDSNREVLETCKIPVNLLMMCLIWEDKDVRVKFEGEFNISVLYHEVVVWLTRRYENKFGTKDGFIKSEKQLLSIAEVRFLSDIAHHSFVEGKAIIEQGLMEDIFSRTEYSDRLDVHKINNFGLLKAELEAVPLEENNFSFAHLTFHEYLFSNYLRRELQTNPERAAEFIARNRNDSRYLAVLKFLSGTFANEAIEDRKTPDTKVNKGKKSENDKVAVAFWEAVTCNIEGVLELDVNAKVKLLIHLLGQAKGKDGKLDDRIPNLDQLVKLVDETVLSNIGALEEALVSSGYMSEGILDGLVRASEEEASIAGKSRAEEEFGFREYSQSNTQTTYHALRILTELLPQHLAAELISIALSLLSHKDWLVRKAASEFLKRSTACLEEKDHELQKSVFEKLLIISTQEPLEEIRREILKIVGSIVQKTVDQQTLDTTLETLKTLFYNKDGSLNELVFEAIVEVTENLSDILLIKKVVNVICHPLQNRHNGFDIIAFSQKAIEKAVTHILKIYDIKIVFDILQTIFLKYGTSEEKNWDLVAVYLGFKDALRKISDRKALQSIFDYLKNLITDTSTEPQLKHILLEALNLVIKNISKVSGSDGSNLTFNLIVASSLLENEDSLIRAEVFDILANLLNYEQDEKNLIEAFAIVQNAFNHDLSIREVKSLLKVIKIIVGNISDIELIDNAFNLVASLASFANKYDINQNVSETLTIIAEKLLDISEEVLITWLNSPEISIREAALNIFYNLLDKITDIGKFNEAFQLIKSLYIDSDDNIKIKIANIIAKAGYKTEDTETIKAALELLKPLLVNEDTKNSALTALEIIIERTSDIRILLIELDLIKHLLSHENQNIQKLSEEHREFKETTTISCRIEIFDKVVIAIQKNEGEKATLDVLKQLFKDTNSLILQIVSYSIGKITNTFELETKKELFGLLKPLLFSDNINVIEKAVIAVGSIAHWASNIEIAKIALSILRPFLQHENYAIRKQTIGALGSVVNGIDDLELVKEILGLLKPFSIDQNCEIRESLSEAIENITKNLSDQNTLIQILNLQKPLLMDEVESVIEATSSTLSKIITSIYSSQNLSNIILTFEFLASANDDLRKATITLLSTFLKSLSQGSYDKLKIVKLLSKIYAYKDALQAAKDAGMQEAEEILALLPKVLSSVAEGTDRDFIELILGQQEGAKDQETEAARTENARRASAEVDEVEVIPSKSLFDTLLAGGARSFLEKLYSLVLSQCSGVVIEPIQLQYIIKCLESGFTTSFIREEHKHKIIFDGQVYEIKFPAGTDQTLEFEHLVRLAFEANPTHRMVQQYTEHKPLLPNTGSGIKVSTVDEASRKSLVDEGIDVSFDGWKISVVNVSNDKFALKESFLLLEYRDHFGSVQIYKISADGSVRHDSMRPSAIDTNYRKKIFGEMDYLFQKPIYLVTEIPSAIEYETVMVFLEQLNKRGVKVASGNGFADIVRIAREGKLLTDKEIKDLGLDLEWTAYTNSPFTKPLDVKAVLDLQPGTDLSLYGVAEVAIAGYLTLKQNSAQFEFLLAKASADMEVQGDLDLIRQNPYMNGFYEALRRDLGNTYLAAKTLVEGLAEKSKKDGAVVTVGTILKNIGEYVPTVGVGVKLIGDIIKFVGRKLEAQRLQNFSDIAVDITEMSAFAELLARKIVLSNLRIEEKEDSFWKSLAQTVFSKIASIASGDIQTLPDITSTDISSAEKFIKGKIKQDEGISTSLILARRLFGVNTKEKPSFDEIERIKGELDAHIVAKIITMMIFGGKLSDMRDLDQKLDLVVKEVSSKFSVLQKTDIQEEDAGPEDVVDAQPVEEDKADSIAKKALAQMIRDTRPGISWHEDATLQSKFVHQLATHIRKKCDQSKLGSEDKCAEYLARSNEIRGIVDHSKTGFFGLLCCRETESHLSNRFEEEGFWEGVPLGGAFAETAMG